MKSQTQRNHLCAPFIACCMFMVGLPLTAYPQQNFPSGGSALFSYAIFYNLPLEIAPGMHMDIRGDVHINNDAWMQCRDSLAFLGKVTVAGDIFNGRHPELNRPPGPRLGEVYFLANRGGLASMGNESIGYLDSTHPDFASLAEQRWGENLRTQEHGVTKLNLPGIPDYVEDADPTTLEKEQLNYAYPIIQPIVNKFTLPQTALHMQSIEKQKFAYKAGLLIQVDTISKAIDYYTYQRNRDGDIEYSSAGDPIKILLHHPHLDTIASIEPYVAPNEQIISGMFDWRQQRGMNIVEIDVGKLKDLIHANDAADSGGTPAHKPENWWNGVIYVQFPQSNTLRPDGVNPAANDDWGVKLVNGSIIPNPQWSIIKGTTIATNQVLYVQGHYNADGDFRTGSPTEPDNFATFARQDHEAPAALVADAITFLSNNWDDLLSNQHISYRQADSTEVSAALLAGIVPTNNEGTGAYSGGVENFPRLLESWHKNDLVIRGSMAALFESEVGTGVFGSAFTHRPPYNRQWGLHEAFTAGILPPATPYLAPLKAVTYADYAATHRLIAGPTGDDNYNGLSNIVEFALQRLPTDPLAPALALKEENDRMICRFYRDPTLFEIGYVVEASSDLRTWDILFDSRSTDTLNSDGDYHEVLDTETVTPRRFFRLSIAY